MFLDDEEETAALRARRTWAQIRIAVTTALACIVMLVGLGMTMKSEAAAATSELQTTAPATASPPDTTTGKAQDLWLPQPEKSKAQPAGINDTPRPAFSGTASAYSVADRNVLLALLMIGFVAMAVVCRALWRRGIKDVVNAETTRRKT